MKRHEASSTFHSDSHILERWLELHPQPIQQDTYSVNRFLMNLQN